MQLGPFADLDFRPDVDGCDTIPFVSLAASSVEVDLRRSGFGAALVRAGDDWARQQSYHQFTYDASLENKGSHRAYAAVGFDDVECAIRYRKEP